MERNNTHTTTLTIVFVASVVMLIAGVVVTVTQQAAFAQPTNPKKVTICHDGDTTTTGAPSVPAHIRNHGDTIGPCPPVD